MCQSYLVAGDGVEVMERKRVRIQKPKGRRERWCTEVFPLDPRDPDVLRAKRLVSPGRARTDQRDPATVPDRNLNDRGRRIT